MSVVTNIEVADSKTAENHFLTQLSLETDCWDVHHAIANERQDFILLDVRGEKDFQRGHLPKAIHLPHARLNEKTLASFPHSSCFVVYCAGPHCNGADKAALRLAKLKRPVKKMLGGITGWLDEGFDLISEVAIEM